MMTHKILFILLVAFGLSAGIKAENLQTKNTNTQIDTEAKDSLIILNYLHASLNKISMYNDKRVLEEEYDNIINNINLRAINDKEILDIVTELMDVLSAFRLKEMEKEQMQKNREKNLEKVLMAVALKAAGNIHISQSAKITKTSLSSIASIAASATTMTAESIAMFPVFAAVATATTVNTYIRMEEESQEAVESAEWELKKLAITELNKIRKKFIILYWSIMKKYSIPDQWRITEKQLKKFVNILKEKDENKKFRQLSRMKDELLMLPIFWFELSLSAHSLGKKGEEYLSIMQYEKLNYKLLRKNAQYSLMLAHKIAYLHPKTQKYEIEKLLKTMNEVDPESPERKLFMAMEYAIIGNTHEAEELLNENMDDGFLTEISERLKVKLYAASNNIDEYKKIVDRLLKQQKLSVYEALMYLGEYPVASLAKDVKDGIENINIQISTNLLSKKDNLVVKFPKKWVLKDIEDAKLVLVLNGVEKRYDTLDIEENDLVYIFKKIFAKSDLKKRKIDRFKLKLIYRDVPTEITYKIQIQKLTVDNSGSKENNKTYTSNFFDKIYKDGKKLYAKFKSKIIFVPETIHLGSSCFDVRNNMKTCTVKKK